MKIVNIIFIVLLFFSCETNHQKGTSNEVKLSDYFNDKQVDSLEYCIDSFDLYLEKEYTSILKENRINYFLTDITQLYSSIETDSLSKEIFSFDTFLDEISSLEKSDFFIDDKMSKKKVELVENWRLNIMKSYYNVDIDSINTNEIYRFESNGLGSDFYYGIYQTSLMSNDTISTDWIESIVNFSPSSSALFYLKNNTTRNYLNSKTCKLLIFTEFVLPAVQSEKLRPALRSARSANVP
jgi:hypothetical protein